MEDLKKRKSGEDGDSPDKRGVDDDRMRHEHLAVVQNTVEPFATLRHRSTSSVSDQSSLLSTKRGINDVSLLLLIGEKRRRIHKQLGELHEMARRIQGRFPPHDPTNGEHHGRSMVRNHKGGHSATSPRVQPLLGSSILDRRTVQYDFVTDHNLGEAALLWASGEYSPISPPLTTDIMDRHSIRRPSINPILYHSIADAAAVVDSVQRDTRKLQSYPARTNRKQNPIPRTSVIKSLAVPSHPHQGAKPATVSPPPTANMPMSLPADSKYLSEYQVLVRRALEFYVASEQDINTSQKGRKRKVRLHQVGIRCSFCAHLHPSLRTRGSSTYPRSKSSFYLCAQNIIMAHLVPPPTKPGSKTVSHPCHCLPPELAKSLAVEKAKQCASAVGSGYWANEGCAYDTVERDGAVWLAS